MHAAVSKGFQMWRKEQDNCPPACHISPLYSPDFRCHQINYPCLYPYLFDFLRRRALFGGCSEDALAGFGEHQVHHAAQRLSRLGHRSAYPCVGFDLGAKRLPRYLVRPDFGLAGFVDIRIGVGDEVARFGVYEKKSSSTPRVICKSSRFPASLTACSLRAARPAFFCFDFRPGLYYFIMGESR